MYRGMPFSWTQFSLLIVVRHEVAESRPPADEDEAGTVLRGFSAQALGLPGAGKWGEGTQENATIF
jgi:hypothetical protein